MDCKSSRIPYRQTNAFSKIVFDYIDQAEQLKSFFSFPPSLKGIQQAIEARKSFKTDRETLMAVLKEQYASVEKNETLDANLQSILSPDTFTITTAHQNNIFTGPLYFIYKIVHTIRLADHLKEVLPAYHFVPVFYMGTEDADLAELNNINLGGEKLEWKTRQQGAVGRMKIDKDLLSLIAKMEGQLSVLPKGKELISVLKDCYREGRAIQEATFHFVHYLFGEYGLVVLIADDSRLKKQMRSVFEDDLLDQTASKLVEATAHKLEQARYKVQAHPREINLFYLKDDLRERIEEASPAFAEASAGKGKWRVVSGMLSFTREELINELKLYPERFSPNVILRGLYQETILPNITFIGGGGEVAYWLQLKDLFDHYKIPFPVLVLRNSFLLVEGKWREKMGQLGLEIDDFFLPEQEITNKWVARESKVETKLNGSLAELEKLYDLFKRQANAVDKTLEKHVDALKTRTVFRLQELEKKMLRAAKRKFTDQHRQIHTIKAHLFPFSELQERYENLAYYYALWGKEFIPTLVKHSPALEQEFTILSV